MQNMIKSWLTKFLRDNFDMIVAQWVKNIRQDISAYRSRPHLELVGTISEHLHGVIDAIAEDDYEPLIVFMEKIAAMRVQQEFSLADIQQAFLIGKDTICDMAIAALGDQAMQLLPAYKMLERPFHRTLYLYSSIYQKYAMDKVKTQAQKIAKIEEEQRFLLNLQQEKEKLEMIIEAVGLDVAILNKKMEIEWSYSYLLGGNLSRNDRVGFSCSVLDWHESEGCDNCPAKRCFKSGQTETGIAMVEGHQRNRAFRIISKPIFDANRHVARVMEVVYEVTDIYQLQNRLIEQSEWHSSIVNGTSEAIICIDQDQRISAFNPAAERIFQISFKEVLNKPLDQIIPELGGFTKTSKNQLNKLRVTLHSQHHDGEQRWLEVNRFDLMDTDDTKRGSSLIIRDITDKLKLEEKVLQAERMGMVGLMAAKVAHEIRNPLSSISLNSELLMDELEELPSEKTAEARELLSAISAEIERLVQLTDDYLSFSRLPQPKPVLFNVNNLIQDLCQFLEQEFSQRKIKVISLMDKKVPAIKIDNQQMRRVFLNLIRNSTEAMPNGGELVIETEKNNGHIEIRFKDSGEGIAEADLGKIFTPFFSTKASGTGLGLSIARQIVEDNGGRMECISKVGKGTTFFIHFPC